jgi:hypothetical protein
MRCGYETTFILGVVETNHDRNYGGGEGDDGAANSGMSIGGDGLVVGGRQRRSGILLSLLAEKRGL